MKKTNRVTIFICLAFLTLFSCKNKEEKHFINDPEIRQEVREDFLKRREIAGKQIDALSYLGELTTEEKEALEFLYAYMPLSDLGDYDAAFFLNQVRYAFKARDFFSWGKTVPEDVFRHFVLVYRVNNENLDTARMVFFEELKERVKDMSMYDAALEVNHWCHEKVTYRPSDGRTSAPLATIKTAYGRCGEESTFTVTAMRAAGIPARQCYTPRWAHTDDNHAWVEVWVDGQWYYLGACEPDAELNMGWFDIPATRTMMVHSNAFGKYHGKEEINHSGELYARINMLPNYTDTKKIEITVLDKNNKPVPDAEVKFKLYNLAEYYPIATQQTDKNGKARLTTGLGDLLIWASKDGVYAFDQIKVRKQDGMTLVLDESKPANTAYIIEYDMVPPSPKLVAKKATQEKIDLTNKRIQYEDSIRSAYIATFMTEQQAHAITNGNLTSDQIWRVIQKSEGNYAEMQKLMGFFIEQNDNLLLNEFFLSLSDKDHRDGNADILKQHITLFNVSDYPKDIYLKGIISPRIDNEGLRPWRPFLAKNMPKVLNNDCTPDAVMDWIENNITVDDEGNYHNCPISPQGVFELRRGDQHSIDIFFVAACRSLNIPAYKDLATGQLYAYENGEWNKFPLYGEQVKGDMATLILSYPDFDPKDPDNKPKYWYHYTIAREENGDFKTYDYMFDEEEDKPPFPISLEIEPGYYLLSTGSRYFEGDVRSRMEFFTVEPNQTVTKEIILLPLEPRKIIYGTIDMNYQLNLGNNTVKTIQELTLDKDLIVCFIDPTREPTTHLLKDIKKFTPQFDKWGGNLLFLLPSDKSVSDLDEKKKGVPKHSIFISDQASAWMNNILGSIKTEEFKGNYPLVFIISPDGKVTLKSEGYRIGTGELLLKSLTQ
ncbi:MAG: transglutaminase domain-containing protein [Bacteroidales bacterium]|jgi:transglutaminase-like putative cysteine protease|nr:transglutaminase domain-containing protein [Bacteroidales bacterium]